jgi:XRE family transcriptional regulator, aerobic/anaerobic benzoate catabolism transcriptional regulator
MPTDTSTPAPEPRRGALPGEEAYLRNIGERLRMVRAGRGMTRKILARASGVSERYLADLEQGTGNASLLVLKQIADAMAVKVADLVRDGTEPSADVARLVQRIQALPSDDVKQVSAWVERQFPGEAKSRDGRIALVGLRGAGKTTVGSAVAAMLNRPFIELDREIEVLGGKPLAQIIADDGQATFRKLELEALATVLRRHERAVIATGGGLVTETSAFGLLRASCFVIWLKAEPDVHMSRVLSQGDTRPMADNPEAMTDLKAILASRGHLYALADASIDTSAATVDDTVAAVVAMTSPSGKALA